jgi:hypothetical protein
MEEKIFWSIYFLATLELLFTIILVWFFKRSSSYNLLLFYLIITLFQVFFKTSYTLNIISVQGKLIESFEEIYVVFHFYILSNLITKNTHNQKKFSIFNTSILVFLSLIYLLVEKSALLNATISNCLLVLLSLFYYHEFQNRIENENSITDDFYIITGIFLSSSMLIPILFLAPFLKKYLNKESFYIIGCIAPISSIVYYSFIIYTIKCNKVFSLD